MSTRRQLILSVEHRAAAAPEPVTLALIGSDNDMHLAIVDSQSQGDHDKPLTSADLDAAVLDALDHADNRGLQRASLRTALRVRNQRLGETLTRLLAAGQIVRHGNACLRRSSPVPAPIHTPPEREPERGITEA